MSNSATAIRDIVDEQQSGNRLVLLPPVPARNGNRAERWAAACAMYRRAVENYARALRLQQQRIPPRAPHRKQIYTGDAVAPAPVTAQGLDELTSREHEVFTLIARGLTNQEIAEALVITRGTAANHVAHVLSKLRVSNRTQVLARFFTFHPESS